MEESSPSVVGDLSTLPGSATGPAHLVWWGNIGFMLIEGMVFLLACACYLYLAGQSPAWPPVGTTTPDLLWGGLFTGALLLSEIPNLFLLRASTGKKAAPSRWLAVLMTLLVTGLLAIRGVEFAHLNVSWHDNAYGSVVWMLMILHTIHLFTELGETGVQAIWLFTHKIGDDQFADVEDDANYWTFVVIAWVPIYGLVYWMPRWV